MSKSGENFLYFLVGGFVGASIALLLAPTSGKETRELITGRAREGADFVTAKTRQIADLTDSASRALQDQASQLLDRSAEVLNRQKEQLAAAVEAGRQAYHEEKAKLHQE
ncbi:MAG: YtxH domain-containing protein [Acidobacteria bacterium]|nr:YtxH domain-containing protein [Acidobacteriota bacterium]